MWSSLIQYIGSDNFYIHHRVSLQLFDKIHKKISPHIYTDPKYVRRTCVRGDVSHVDTRSRLSMTLKHLGGSRTCDIAHFQGVSRTTVTNSIRATMSAILKEYPIPPFPFNNESMLQKMADGFKSKSTDDLIDNVVGAVDGFLLRIGKRSIGNKSGIQDPSKFYCRKRYYAVNCQVCCDSNRKVTSLSMLSPGAVPDTLAFLKSSLHRGLETGQLPKRFCIVGDGAYPSMDQILKPCKRPELRRDTSGVKDSYNFYVSQLRINIECCFGMLINKFPILQSALKTPLLRNAVDIFTVCCIIHNLCIDERLENNNNQPSMSFTPGKRYTQVARETTGRSVLQSHDDFEFVDIVDEVSADSVSITGVRLNTGDVVDSDDDDDDMNIKERLLRKIVRKGYVRPRQTV